METKSKYELTLNSYGNIDGVPEGWVTTGLTVSQLKKLEIPNYKSCVGFDESYYGRKTYYKPIVVNIIPQDFEGKAVSYKQELENRKAKARDRIDGIELTQSVIGECLYSINKEAKRLRDVQANAIDRAFGYDEDTYQPSKLAHYQLHMAKNEKERLYNLKDEVIQLAITTWNLKPEGYHEFADGNRDMYVIAGYKFHVNENTSDKKLGDIDEVIDSKRSRSIPPKKAEQLLWRFLKENRN